MKKIPLPVLVLLIPLVVGVIRWPSLWRDFVRVDVLAVWHNPDEQYRRLYGATLPYDALRQAEQNLAPAARVLLVTNGNDVKRVDYVIYHRALYFLAPRPVVWVAPAPSDGSWEARQWLTTELTSEAMGEIAAARQLTCLLAVNVPTTTLPGRVVATWDDMQVRQLSEAPCLRDVPALRPLGAGTGWPLRLAAALLTIFLLGNAFLVGVRKLGYAAAPLEGLILAWFCGAVLLSLLLLWTGAIGLSLPRQQISLTGLAFVWGIKRLLPFLKHLPSLLTHHASSFRFQVSGFKSQVSGSKFQVSSGISLVLGLIILAHILLVTVLLLGRPFFIWDSWIGWSIKARILFLEGGLTPALYAEPTRAITLQSYPLFLPLLYAWIYQWLGAPDDRLIGVVPLFFYLALIGAVWLSTRQFTTRLHAWLAAAAVASFGHIILLYGSAYTDGVLVVAAALTAFYWHTLLHGGRFGKSPTNKGHIILAAFCAGSLPWIKQDGLLLLGVFSLIYTVRFLFSRTTHACPEHSRRDTARRLLLATTLSTLLIAAPWYLFVRGRAFNVSVFLPMTPTTFLNNLDRLPIIAQHQIQNLLHPLWNFFWPLFLLLLVWQATKKKSDFLKKSDFWLLAAFGLYLFLTSLIFVFSGYPPYTQHILTSVHRLLAHGLALPLLWLHTTD